ncbi:MAG: LptF/LptG family permease [Alphaproteobacteria bacterium]|nr:LptF/LptG family permease [Alphaproteobacteria bacterium]
MIRHRGRNAQGSGVASQLWVAVFGRETRYVGRLYLERIVLVVLLISAVVLSLDTASTLGGFLNEARQLGTASGFARMGYYLILRAGYNLPSILPMAALLGVIWVEFSLARSRQRIMIANSGRAQLVSLAPSLLVGLIIGLSQFVAVAHIRPASVEAQATEGFRDYGPRFHSEVSGEELISVEGAVIKARIAFGEPPTLRDALIFEIAEDGALRTIYTARQAAPVEQGLWLLSDGSVWSTPGFFGTASPVGQHEPVEVFDSRLVELSLLPLYANNVGIQPARLPQAVLARLAAAPQGVQNPTTYRAAYQDRFAAILYVVGMTLLPAVLSILWFSPQMSSAPVVGIMFWCVGIYFLASLFSQLGSYGYLPAPISAWSIPSLAVAGAIWMGTSHARARGGGT